MPHQSEFGRYRLLAELGHGGMADVYLSCLNGPGGFTKLSVIKVARLSDDPAFVQMFLDEARLAARLSHPNVVQTFEVGEESGRQFIVMEYLDGPALNLLQRRAATAHGALELRLLVQILSQALEGLHYAHTLADFDGQPLRVVHRDLTPHNLIITVQGICKVLDFGIAKAADSRTVTQTGFYRGKLNYMSPEQARGDVVDARADVFSVGVILAEAIRRQPFWGEANGPVIAARLLAGDVPTVRGSGADPQLEEICARALTADRNQRLRSALEFKQRLDWYLNATGGHISNGQLAAYVQPLVAADRARIRAVLEATMKNPNGQSSAFALPRIEAGGATPGATSRANVAHATVTPARASFDAYAKAPEPSSDGNVIITVVEPMASQPAPPPAAPNALVRRLPWVVGISSVVIVSLIAVGMWRRSEPPPSLTPPVVTPRAQPSIQAALPPPASPPATPAPPPAEAPSERAEGALAKPVPAPAPVPPAPVAERHATKAAKGSRARSAAPAPPAEVVAPEPVVAEPIAPPSPKKDDKRALDTDVFDEKKRELDRDPWKQ